MNALRKPEPEHVTEAEFNEMEQHAEIRHELVNGEVYAMAGASPRHNDLAANVLASLHGQLRDSECRPRTSDQRLKVEATGMQSYPDVLVACPPLRYDEGGCVLLDATVIIKVLSPSTARFDRGAKYLHFQQLPSLRHYVLVEQDHIGVEHRKREAGGEWKVEVFARLEDALSLDAIGCTLSLDDIYERLGLDPALSLLPAGAQA